MSYKILIGCWCHIIVLKVYATRKVNIDYAKDSFYEEMERVFDIFLIYHIKNSVRRVQC